MTVEERFDRIEPITAGPAEERKKDREEYRQLWRDPQRPINKAARLSGLTPKAADRNEAVTRPAEETRAADPQLRRETRAADLQPRERIESLVPATGKRLSKQQPE